MKSADYCYGEITPTPPPTNLPTSNPTSVPTSLPSFNPTSNPTAVVSSSLIFFYLICCIQNSFWVYVNENIMRSYDVATSFVLGTAHISGTNMHILFYHSRLVSYTLIIVLFYQQSQPTSNPTDPDIVNPPITPTPTNVSDYCFELAILWIKLSRHLNLGMHCLLRSIFIIDPN